MEFFLEKYPAIIYQVRVEIKQTIWRRAQVSSGAHEHGFYRHGPEYNVVDILGNKQGYRRIISGVRDLIVLKTTQTGFENFYRNEHTTLPDAKDRLLGTNISASWLLGDKNLNFNEIRRKISEAMTETFFGNAQRGVYSYSVQQTLHDMGVASLRSCPDVKEIKLSLPNIHFLPYHHLGNLGSKFENDIYLPTDEPHGLIQATVARGEVSPSILARL